MGLKCVSQKVAQAIDNELMCSAGGFSVDQLMELAGLSVAQAIQKTFNPVENPRVFVCVGPGNNGGDGLVAARHLFHFGFKPTLYYPKQPEKDLYQRLLLQCRNLELPVYKELLTDTLADTDVILDSLFGFSFHGDIREPYREIIQALNSTNKPIVSVDIPSGWDVDRGPTTAAPFQPQVLVSLTAPKPCSAYFKGKHYLGGRFVPPSLAAKFDFQIPAYPAGDQVVALD
ncbi:apolipo protein A-I-binding protein-like protein [Sporodiniella umbellata]|nr:apolipo protein A-I-binding protein-like protein [Sporodiniella umbellata]